MSVEATLGYAGSYSIAAACVAITAVALRDTWHRYTRRRWSASPMILREVFRKEAHHVPPNAG